MYEGDIERGRTATLRKESQWCINEQAYILPKGTEVLVLEKYAANTDAHTSCFVDVQGYSVMQLPLCRLRKEFEFAEPATLHQPSLPNTKRRNLIRD